jgi:hypothetical protein
MRTSFAIPLLSASFITSMAEVNSGTTAEKSLAVATAQRLLVMTARQSQSGDRSAVNEVKR